jgi:hypothetical protein
MFNSDILVGGVPERCQKCGGCSHIISVTVPVTGWSEAREMKRKKRKKKKKEKGDNTNEQIENIDNDRLEHRERNRNTAFKPRTSVRPPSYCLVSEKNIFKYDACLHLLGG